MYSRSNTPGLVVAVVIRYYFDIRHEVVSNGIVESPREELFPRRCVRDIQVVRVTSYNSKLRDIAESL